MMKYILTVFAVFLSVILTAQTTLDTATNFIAKDIYGNRIELFEFLDDDKIVVIDFFNTSCGPCQTYAPDMQASYEDFGSNEGNVIFLGISKGDDNAMVAHFDSVFGITYPSVSGSQGGGNGIHTQFNILGTPTVIVIKPDREISAKHIWEPITANINDAVLNAGGIMVGFEEYIAYSENLSVFPNPALSGTNIHFISSGNLYSILLFDITGKAMLSIPASYFPAGIQSIRLDLSEIPEGIYLLGLESQGVVVGKHKVVIL